MGEIVIGVVCLSVCLSVCLLLDVFVVGASSGLDGYIKLWDMESGKLLRSIDGGPGESTSDDTRDMHVTSTDVHVTCTLTL